MKKIYSLLLVALGTFTVNAQTNLVANGGFEAWTDGEPEGFTIYTSDNGGSITQETTDVQEGSSAALFTAPAGTGNTKLVIQDIPVTAGDTYVFSYWFKDESDNAKGRHWASWRDGDGAQMSDNADVLRPNYIENSNGWQEVTYTLVAPADAAAFRIDFRVYQQDNGADSGIILYDNVMFYDQSTASSNTNNISGLKLYPNPVTGNMLNITSDNNYEKLVAIYDVLGKQVVNTVTKNGTVNVSNLNSGVYIVKITEEGKTATRKLVVK